MRHQPGTFIIKKISINLKKKTQTWARKLSRPSAEYVSLEQRRHEAHLCDVFKYKRGFNGFTPDQLLIQ